jgi:hypothetical protein
MRSTGRSVGEVLDVLAGIDEVAGSGAITSAVATAALVVPPPGRLTLWLARSVLDDLADWRRRAAALVLIRDANPSAAVATWAAANADVLAAATGMLGSSSQTGVDLLDTAVLVVRRLQRTI